jgi:hypothetical protein
MPALRFMARRFVVRPAAASGGEARVSATEQERAQLLRRMPEVPAYTVKIESDANRAGRYRWKILHSGKPRDKSLFSFATRREAQADADKFVEKLKSTWNRPVRPPEGGGDA